MGDPWGDGDADPAVANGASDNIGNFLNAGDGTLAPDGRFDAGNPPGHPMIGDLDGDADAHLAVANPAGDGRPTAFGLLVFQGLFDLGSPLADSGGDDELALFDFLAFQNAFGAGCP